MASLPERKGIRSTITSASIAAAGRSGTRPARDRRGSRCGEGIRLLATNDGSCSTLPSPSASPEALARGERRASQTALSRALARSLPDPLLRPPAPVGRGATQRSGRSVGGSRARARCLVDLGSPQPRPLAVAHLRGLRLAAARTDPGAQRRHGQSSAGRRAAAGHRPAPAERQGRMALPRGAEPARSDRPGYRRPVAGRSQGLRPGRPRGTRAGGLGGGAAAAARTAPQPQRRRPGGRPDHRLLQQIAPPAPPAGGARRGSGRPPASDTRLRAPRSLSRPPRLQRRAG